VNLHASDLADDSLLSKDAPLSKIAPRVKLDMDLVRGIDAHRTKRSIVTSMVTLCHDMGAKVVAEGVETEAERDALVELGCDLLQGYLFAKPGPAFPHYVW